MTDLAALRSQAETLAASLPALAFRSTASQAPHVGSAGRRKAGTGEHFWQYRRYAHEDSAERIDWRRSARSNDLFVRESELETARTVLFWCDPHPGFDWRGDDQHRTKADEARLLMLAVGVILSREGERIGVLGSGRGPGFGRRAVDRLAEDLCANITGSFPQPPSHPASLIIASDFYDGLKVWRERLSALAATCREGVLLAIADPVEQDFPFKGRVRLSRPGDTLQRLFGRAESIRETYRQRFAENREAIKSLAAQLDWRFVAHDTAKVSLAGAAGLKRALETYGGTH